MTKREAAMHLLGVARSIHRENAGDEDADVWIIQLLWIAQSLDSRITQHDAYVEVLTEGDSRKAKLRRLIDHPATPSTEREAAVAALAKVRRLEAK